MSEAWNLMPCPFCGGKAEIMGGSLLMNLIAICQGCGASSREITYADLEKPVEEKIRCIDRKSSEFRAEWEAARETLAEKAVAAWNRRLYPVATFIEATAPQPIYAPVLSGNTLSVKSKL